MSRFFSAETKKVPPRMDGSGMRRDANFYGSQVKAQEKSVQCIPAAPADHRRSRSATAHRARGETMSVAAWRSCDVPVAPAKPPVPEIIRRADIELPAYIPGSATAEWRHHNAAPAAVFLQSIPARTSAARAH